MSTELFPRILVACIVALSAVPAHAADDAVPTYRLFDYSAGGEIDARSGLQLAFDISGMPDGFWGSDVMRRDVELLCKTYAPPFLSASRKKTSATLEVIRVEIRGLDLAAEPFEMTFDTDGEQCLKARADE